MQPFLAGFIVALALTTSILLLLCRKKASKNNAGKNENPNQLEELSRLTGELAHEIKNPLSTIKINLKLTAEELEASEKNNHSFARALRKLAVIQKEADRVEQILDGFLRYLDRGELQVENADINELLSDMVDFYSPQATSRSITIRMGLCNQPLVCKVDVDMLKQAILNLFINARQAMSEGGELLIRTASQEGNAVIEISDTGIGIEREKLANIFDAFYSSRPQGSGLGLPTTKKIVEAHNGSIAVNSEPGKGTSFTIKLPFAESGY
jgi:signal transduction histidine kinase